MSIARHGRRPRHKRWTPRLANDLRTLAPLLALAFCFAGSATAIYASQHVPALLVVAPQTFEPEARDERDGLASVGPCGPKTPFEVSQDAGDGRR